MNTGDIEKRSHFRCDLANPIEYVLDSTAEGPFKGATINSCKRGLCFFTFHPLKKEEQIRIVKSLLPLPGFSGVVCWSAKIDLDFYKVGLRFTDGKE